MSKLDIFSFRSKGLILLNRYIKSFYNQRVEAIYFIMKNHSPDFPQGKKSDFVLIDPKSL